MARGQRIVADYAGADAQQTLAAFGVRMRDEVELERLTESLLSVVDETMQPAHASLWFRKSE